MDEIEGLEHLVHRHGQRDQQSAQEVEGGPTLGRQGPCEEDDHKRPVNETVALPQQQQRHRLIHAVVGRAAGSRAASLRDAVGRAGRALEGCEDAGAHQDERRPAVAVVPATVDHLGALDRREVRRAGGSDELAVEGLSRLLVLLRVLRRARRGRARRLPPGAGGVCRTRGIGASPASDVVALAGSVDVQGGGGAPTAAAAANVAAGGTRACGDLPLGSPRRLLRLLALCRRPTCLVLQRLDDHIPPLLPPRRLLRTLPLRARSQRQGRATAGYRATAAVSTSRLAVANAAAADAATTAAATVARVVGAVAPVP